MTNKEGYPTQWSSCPSFCKLSNIPRHISQGLLDRPGDGKSGCEFIYIKFVMNLSKTKFIIFTTYLPNFSHLYAWVTGNQIKHLLRNLESFKFMGIDTAQPKPQPNSTSTRVGSVYIMLWTTPPTRTTHPMKLFVVIN